MEGQITDSKTLLIKGLDTPQQQKQETEFIELLEYRIQANYYAA
jgi:hypothetical protein